MSITFTMKLTHCFVLFFLAHFVFLKLKKKKNASFSTSSHRNTAVAVSQIFAYALQKRPIIQYKLTGLESRATSNIWKAAAGLWDATEYETSDWSMVFPPSSLIGWTSRPSYTIRVVLEQNDCSCQLQCTVFVLYIHLKGQFSVKQHCMPLMCDRIDCSDCSVVDIDVDLMWRVCWLWNKL